MNKEVFKYRLFATRTESNLKNELDILKAIEEYQATGCVMGISKNAILDLVDQIISDKPDRNQMRPEEIGKWFHIQEYDKCRLVLDVIYYIVGLRWSEDESKHTLDALAFAEESMWHGFFLGFSIAHKKLAELVRQIDAYDELFLLKCQSMTVDRSQFVNFCMKELNDNLTDEEIIDKMNHYNDGSYIELPPGIATLSRMIIREDAFDVLTDFICRLRYFPLQGSVILSLNTIEQCIAVWKEIANNGYIRFKVVAHLLREQMLRVMAKQTEMLERNAQSDSLSAEYLEYGRRLFDGWNMKFEDNCKEMTNLWISVLGVQDTCKWFSNGKARLMGRPSKFVEYDLKAMTAIEKSLTPYVNINSDDIAEADFQTILFYMKLASVRDMESTLFDELVERFCHLSYNGRYVPQLKLEEQTFDYLRDIYSCILKSDVDGISLVLSERSPMEGYHVDWDKAFRSCSADSLWFSVLLLQTETTGNKAYFWKVMDNLFRFANYERSTVTDYYFMPFYIAEIIAIQILKEEKDRFEEMLINRISNLHFLLRVLTANEGALSEENREALRLRCKYEWSLEKELTIKQMQEQTDFLDGYVRKTV